ncbi:MAG: oligosaccharide flippase family protein [Elusimicrobia bacterium]|nr:oligosaccharide flippase family protein [Elusimicrobiota bacterium]
MEWQRWIPARLEMGKNTRAFFQGLGWIGAFYLSARFLSLLTQTTAGRILGPAEFGKTSLILASSIFLMIPMQLGFAPASVKFISMEDSHEKQARVISTIFWSASLWTLVCLLLLFLFKNSIENLLKLDPAFFLWSCVYALATSFYYLIGNFLQGLKEFRRRGLLEITYGALALILFFFLARFHRADYTALILGLTAALIASGLAGISHIKSYLRLAFDPAGFKNILTYTLPPVLNAVSAFLLYPLTVILLNRFTDAESVGIFSAYAVLTFIVSNALLVTVNTVLMPLSTAPETQEGAWRRYLRLLPALLGLGFALFVLSSASVPILMGKAYPRIPLLILLFALMATFNLCWGISATLFYARDVKGLWTASSGQLLMGLCAFLLNVIYIPRYGLIAAASSLSIAHLFGALWNLGWKMALPRT